MPLNRLPDVLLSNQTLTGVSADYLDGITSSTFSQSLRANRNINGGGTVTFDINGNLYWSNRFIIISNGRGPHYALDGYFDAYCPTSGTINGFGSAATRSATGAGINLGQWDALYVITPIGGSYNSTSYAVVSYLADFEVPHNWVLIAVRNGEDGFVYLPNGMVLEPGQSKTSAVTGNLKVGTSNTENYIVFRGTNGDQPGGFDHTFIGERIYGGAEQSELVLFKGNDNDTSSGPDRIRLIASNHVFDTYTAPVSGSFSTVTASASNATRMIIKENGHVGIGTITPNTIATSSSPAMLGIVSNAVGTAGLVIRAIASQTSNLQEWQNTFGGVVAKIDNNAIFNSLNSGSGADSYSSIIIGGRWIRNEQRSALTRFGVNTGEWHMASNPDNSVIAITDNQVGVFATATTLPTFIIKGVASQTADLQQWQNSAGTVLAGISSSGDYLALQGTSLRASAGSVYGSLQLQNGGTNESVLYPYSAGLIIANAGVTGMTVVKIRGASGQTANLQEWQNSAGTVLGYIGATGGAKFAGLDVQMTGSAIVNIGTAASGLVGLVVRGVASQTANLQEWQNSAGTTLSKIDASGYLSTSKINFTGGTSTVSALALSDGTLSFESTAGQLFSISNSLTGTIFSVNDVSGLPIIEATDLGIVKINELYGQTVFGSGTPTASALTTFVARTTSTVPIVVKGITSQTANLTEWQDSAGTVIANITPAGKIAMKHINGINGDMLSLGSNGASDIFVVGYNSSSSITYINGGSYGPIQVQLNSAANGKFVIKGAASQTADLQQWQDSAGTVLARITSNGILATTVTTYSPFYQGVNGSGGVISIANSQPVTITPQSASISVLVAKGAASQTADLQQWQNSSGAVLAEITASGSLELNGKDIELMNIMGAF